MFIGVSIFLVLIVMGGLIAFLGDRIGSKVGKKRLTLFGLRPKYTSVIVTIISGVMISFTTIAVLAVVNENVRVALFGLSKLQNQMKDLNQEIKLKNMELEQGKKQLEARNKEIEDVTQRQEATSRELERVESQSVYMKNQLAEVQEAYDEAQRGIAQSAEDIKVLENTKEELNKNIQKLNGERKTLLESIYALREGQVIMQAGQVLTSATVDAGMSKEESEKVLSSVLNDINSSIKQQLNISDKETSLIRISTQNFDHAVEQITGAKHKKLVRIVAAQNLILGEPLVVDFDIHDNLLILHKDELVYKGNLDKYKDLKNSELKVLNFLQDLNHYAQSKGILPDPITGKVGQLEGKELMDVIAKVKQYGNNSILEVYAARDIYSSGPLLIEVKVTKKENLQ